MSKPKNDIAAPEKAKATTMTTPSPMMPKAPPTIGALFSKPSIATTAPLQVAPSVPVAPTVQTTPVAPTIGVSTANASE